MDCNANFNCVMQVFLGCYNTDQKQVDDFQVLLEKLHKYVPGHSDDTTPTTLTKVLHFGDYLGFERHKAAQGQVQDAMTPSQRLEGFIGGLSDFHAQAEWHKVCMRCI